MSALPPIPSTSDLPALIAAINDRFRRIGSAQPDIGPANATYTRVTVDAQGRVIAGSNAGKRALAASDIPAGMAQTDITGGTAVNTVYHNSTGKDLLISVVGSVTGTTAGVAYCAASSAPALVVSEFQAEGGGTGSFYGTLMFGVPAGYYWKIATGLSIQKAIQIALY